MKMHSTLIQHQICSADLISTNTLSLIFLSKNPLRLGHAVEEARLGGFVKGKCSKLWSSAFDWPWKSFQKFDSIWESCSIWRDKSFDPSPCEVPTAMIERGYEITLSTFERIRHSAHTMLVKHTFLLRQRTVSKSLNFCFSAFASPILSMSILCATLRKKVLVNVSTINPNTEIKGYWQMQFVLTLIRWQSMEKPAKHTHSTTLIRSFSPRISWIRSTVASSLLTSRTTMPNRQKPGSTKNIEYWTWPNPQENEVWPYDSCALWT